MQRVPTSTRPSLQLPVDEGYKRWARTYDLAPNPLLAREERYLAPVLASLHGKYVLDLACGTGRWLQKLLHQGCASAVGIDLSAAMLRAASPKVATGRVAQANCEHLPLATAAFDFVIWSFALGHMRSLTPTVRELRRVMKIGADVIICDLHPEAHRLGWQAGFSDRNTSLCIEVYPRSVEEIVEAFVSNGFECRRQQSLWLGEPEQPIFARAGKIASFASACQLPAVLVCQFARVGL